MDEQTERRIRYSLQKMMVGTFTYHYQRGAFTYFITYKEHPKSVTHTDSHENLPTETENKLIHSYYFGGKKKCLRGEEQLPTSREIYFKSALKVTQKQERFKLNFAHT